MSLIINAEWEKLDTGTAEERACFAAISIMSGSICLTEAKDTFVKRVRTSVHLSAYRLAKWLAWNWWRLRWEPRTDSLDWQMAHHMTSIGGGYVWPNISIISDGERIVFLAKPTMPNSTEPLRYLADVAVVVRAVEYEGALSQFIEQVQGQLREEGIKGTNLENVWSDVCAERKDPVVAERRRLEALLGLEPDEADDALLDRLLNEADLLGADAIHEMAAMSAGSGHVSTVLELKRIAAERGFQARPRDAVRLANRTHLPPIGQVPAWRRGVEAAQALRKQERLELDPISNKRLAELSGVGENVLTELESANNLSFEIDDEPAESGWIVLRSKWEAGRRFDLARLLGDRIAASAGGRLYPATNAATYRQKLQRSFAAEFLCPYDAVEEQLKGEYSDENQEDVANHFNVSPLTVRTLLVNHGRIDRDDLEREYEAFTVA